MNATDLDPNFFLPLWRALVAYFRNYKPLVQASQNLPTNRTGDRA